MRVLPVLLLLVGLLGVFAWQSLDVLAGTRDDAEAWTSPVDVGSLVPIAARERSSQLPIASPGAGTLRRVDVRLSALALLHEQKARRAQGSSSLVVESFIGDVPVDASLHFTLGPLEGASFDLRGEQRIEGLPAGWHEVEARFGTRKSLHLIRLPSKGTRTLPLRWNRGGAVGELRGVVFDGNGAPLAGVTVELGAHRAETIADGTFVMTGLEYGPERPLVLSKRGYALQFQRVEVRRKSKDAQLRFVLPKGRTVRGVLQLSGTDLAAARLVVLPGADSSSGPTSFPYFARQRAFDIPVDADGRFVIEGLPRDHSFAIAMLHPCAVLHDPVPVPRASSRAFRVHLIPERYPALRGRVVEDGSDRSIDGAELHSGAGSLRGSAWGSSYVASSLAKPLPGFVASLGTCVARSSADGRYAIGVSPKRSEILVESPGHLGTSLRGSGRSGLTKDFHLAPAGPAASGPGMLRLHFDRETADPLELRILRDGDLPGRPFLLPAGEALELPFDQSARVRVRLLLRGEDRPLLDRRLLVRGTRTLSVPLAWE